MSELYPKNAISGPGPYNTGGINRATVNSDQELVITEAERERDIGAKYDTDVGTLKYAILVDLSNNASFLHQGNGRIDISQVYTTVDKTAATNGTIKVGVITAINASLASMSYGLAVPFERNGDTKVESFRHYTPTQLRLGVTSSALTRFVTSDSETGVTFVNTGLTLGSPAGPVIPAVGDVIVKYGFTTGATYTASLQYFYHGQSLP